jgi:type I restriction-modification system DNA methylase subunit
MNSQERKQRLAALLDEYLRFKAEGRLDLTTEETIRVWLNQFLEIFGWDVRDTSQILQEKILSKQEKSRLKEISSTHTTPDYTFKIGGEKLTFLDAKDTSVNLEKDPKAAFQIKSYGYSISAPCAFISNFEEFAIYDCTYIPAEDQEADFGRLYFKIEQYIENYEILESHLLKEGVYKGALNELYSETLVGVRNVDRKRLDEKFADQLSEFRLSLSENILQNNGETIAENAEKLSYFVQIIINRILFIRVCEARRIEKDGLLVQFKQEGFWSAFKESCYLGFYEHYDGHLFDRIQEIHKLTISNEVFDGLLDHLYYPSPYRFDVMPTKLLSDIYEIFLSKRLVIDGNTVKDKIKSEYAKSKGAVSTPQYIVREVIKRTIPRGEIISAGISKIFSHKILDIACGSGVFIIEAYDYIEDIFKELYSNSRDANFDQYFSVIDSKPIINLRGKKALIANCIYGVDIDPEAVEVAKMSLSLKVIDSSDDPELYESLGIFGKFILESVGSNIHYGNSLVESDILANFPAIADDQQEYLRTNAFDWVGESAPFNSVFKLNGGFDFIIGNPPYVEVKNYNTDLPTMHLYMKQKFRSAKTGKVDLAVPFIERGMELLGPKGRLGYIIQNRFFKTEYGENIRQFLTDGSYLSSVIEFEANNIFKDRNTYVAILVLDKNQPKKVSFKYFEGAVEALSSQLRASETPELTPDKYKFLPSNMLSGKPWSFDVDINEVGAKLLQLGTLGGYADIKVGIQVLWVKAYHIQPSAISGGVIQGRSGIQDLVEIEVAACRPLVCNKSFFSYRPDTADVYAIFPYDVSGGSATEIPFSEFAKRFPLAGKYLSANKARISQNVQTFGDDERWHLYTRRQNIESTSPKILVPMTALDTFASVTFSSDVYLDNANVNYIDPPLHDSDTLYALSAIINSTIFSVLARSMAGDALKGFFKLNKQFLDPVPFPINEFENNLKLKIQLANVARKIQVTQETYERAPPSQKISLGKLLQALWISLDDLCFQLYQVNPSEKKLFVDRGRNIDRLSML